MIKLEKNTEEYKENLELNRLCSKCNRYADVVIPREIKLCKKCFEGLKKC